MTVRAYLPHSEVRRPFTSSNQYTDIRTGFYRGIKDIHEDKDDHEEPSLHVPDANGQIYRAVSQHNDHGPYTAYKPLHQLDGRPISELADTSLHSPRSSVVRTAHTIDPPSPIPDSLRIRTTGADEDGVRGKHAMSWNNYDAREAVSPPSTLSSSISPKSAKHQVSPELATDFWTR